MLNWKEVSPETLTTMLSTGEAQPLAREAWPRWAQTTPGFSGAWFSYVGGPLATSSGTLSTTAISQTDLEAQAAMQTPDGMIYQWRPAEGGGMQITARPNSYWTDPSRDDGHVYRERYWSPTVMIRGGIAVVWAPYEFWVDGETSHCGVDVFDFVKIDGEWLVSNAMWTVEPEACTQLRPGEASNLRPED